MSYLRLNEKERIALNTSMFKAYDIRTKSEFYPKNYPFAFLKGSLAIIARFFRLTASSSVRRPLGGSSADGGGDRDFPGVRVDVT